MMKVQREFAATQFDDAGLPGFGGGFGGGGPLGGAGQLGGANGPRMDAGGGHPLAGGGGNQGFQPFQGGGQTLGS